MLRHIGLLTPLLAALLGCPTPPPGESDAGVADAGIGVALSETEASDLHAIWPTAARKVVLAIPDERLSDEERSYENTQVLRIHDAEGVLLGYLRDIFTPVHCVSGACQAIQFDLVFDAAQDWIEIFEPGDRAHPLLKYWNDEHVEFDAADWALLRSLLAAPPAALVGVNDYADLVLGVTETAPTQVAYQDMVVRGAAFTTYEIVVFCVDTGRLLPVLDPQE